MGQKYPAPITSAMVLPAYVPTVTYYGGIQGDDVTQQTANSTSQYFPVNQGNKADMMGTNLATPVNTPRGWIAPNQPYAAPPTPTVGSTVPTTRVRAPTTDLVLRILGTNFMPSSIAYFGGSSDGERTTYVSPTEVTTIIRGDLFTGPDPAVPVKVSNAGVMSNSVNFGIT